MKFDLATIITLVLALLGIGGLMGAHRLRASHNQRRAERERIRREEAEAAQERRDRRVERLARAAEKHAQIKAQYAEKVSKGEHTAEDWQQLRERIREIKRWREGRDE